MEIDFLNPEIFLTEDGSHSLFVSALNESYHSRHGAINESMHIFINEGLKKHLSKEKINILEVGFGTGLNAFLTLLECKLLTNHINYHTVEPFPLHYGVISKLNYPESIGMDTLPLFMKLHESPWNIQTEITQYFCLNKMMMKLEDCSFLSDYYDLVYFDAFSPDVQPELWSAEIFKRIFAAMHQESSLVTYSAKGVVRRNLADIGFLIERIPGPKGKREMIRASKV